MLNTCLRHAKNPAGPIGIGMVLGIKVFALRTALYTRLGQQVAASRQAPSYTLGMV